MFAIIDMDTSRSHKALGNKTESKSTPYLLLVSVWWPLGLLACRGWPEWWRGRWGWGDLGYQWWSSVPSSCRGRRRWGLVWWRGLGRTRWRPERSCCPGPADLGPWRGQPHDYGLSWRQENLDWVHVDRDNRLFPYKDFIGLPGGYFAKEFSTKFN